MLEAKPRLATVDFFKLKPKPGRFKARAGHA